MRATILRGARPRIHIARIQAVSRMPQRRCESTQPPAPGPPKKEVSPHIGFYQTFGTPLLKVFLMATFTYQLAYWAWVKLEKDEIQEERQAEIAGLEEQLQQLVAEKGKTAK